MRERALSANLTFSNSSTRAHWDVRKPILVAFEVVLVVVVVAVLHLAMLVRELGLKRDHRPAMSKASRAARFQYKKLDFTPTGLARVHAKLHSFLV